MRDVAITLWSRIQVLDLDPPVVVIIVFVCGAVLFGAVGVLLAALEHYYAEPIGRGG